MLTPSARTGVAIERQQKILAHIQNNPLGSYVFSGPPGVGKTTLMRELERLVHAQCPKNYVVYHKTASQYQRETTVAARGEHVPRLVRPHSLAIDAAHKIRWAVFLDDLDKVGASEFIQRDLLELFNAVYEEKSSQLVVSTNMNKTELSKFFGDHIARRILEKCAWISMERAQ